MTLKRIFVGILAISALAACTVPHSDLKSPCAGAEGSPCGPHRPVNEWWLNQKDDS